MMIEIVDMGYLELSEPITIERRAKLFEDISTIEGDFSYSFNIPKTKNNVDKIQVFYNSQLRKWNRRIDAIIKSESGVPIYYGYITIDNNLKHEYIASFFSGNTNWIEVLNFDLLDINWESMFTLPSISESVSKNEGVVLTLENSGSLISRKGTSISPDELLPKIYAKTLINTVLSMNGIKLNGNVKILPEFDKMLLSSGGSKYYTREVERRAVYAEQRINQVVTSFHTPIQFAGLNYPFSNSYYNNWNPSFPATYTFDVDVLDVTIDVNLILTSGSDTRDFRFMLYKNDVDIIWDSGTISSFPHANYTVSLNNIRDFNDKPVAGDGYSIRCQSFAGDSPTVLIGSTLRITVNKLTKYFVTDSIPDMKCSDLLTNIFVALNCMITYNAVSKTITANTIDYVVDQPPVQITEYSWDDSEEDFTNFIDGYGRVSLVKWATQSIDEVDIYNQTASIPYATGKILIDNAIIEQEQDIIDLDLTSVWQGNVPMFRDTIPNTGLITLSEHFSRDLTGVDNASGFARFEYSGDDIDFDCLVRISEAVNGQYNGDYYCTNVSGELLSTRPYIGNTTGTISILRIELNDNSPFALLNNLSVPLIDAIGLTSLQIGSSSYSTLAVSNFDSTGYLIGSLSFEKLVEKYFYVTKRALNINDKIIIEDVYLKEDIFLLLDFQSPVKIGLIGLFLLNNITGYIGSKYTCRIELIKIS